MAVWLLRGRFCTTLAGCRRPRNTPPVTGRLNNSSSPSLSNVTTLAAAEPGLPDLPAYPLLPITVWPDSAPGNNATHTQLPQSDQARIGRK